MVVQETVFHALLVLLHRKRWSGVSLSIQNLPEKRIRMIQSNYELELLSDSSNDIFKNNIIDIDRPTLGNFECLLENICLAQFAPHYYKKKLFLTMITS